MLKNAENTAFLLLKLRLPSGSRLAVFPDPAHSVAEERLIGIGKNEQERHILVVFTLRKRKGGTVIRPISARYMHRKEVEHYEKEIAKARK